ncbi:hypothetical protein F5Y18DRAFT_352059 [Xylariaceae sp. FL1019]|nr:hypothetical protein F5Y18DRAFT_352059 [Xylariaceae sp. FL1019]
MLKNWRMKFPQIATSIIPVRRPFLRLNACSAKDGAQQVSGRRSLRPAEDVVLLSVTSTQGQNAFADDTDRDAKSFKLYQCHSQMDSTSEYGSALSAEGTEIFGNQPVLMAQTLEVCSRPTFCFWTTAFSLNFFSILFEESG